MKLSVGMIALNAGATIKAAISSVINIADEIVITLGVVSEYKNQNHQLIGSPSNGWSIDNTLEAIQSFKSPKIKIVIAGDIQPTKTELQNLMLENINPATKIYLKLDADEIMERKALLRAMAMFGDPDVWVISLNYYHYWKSLYHIVTEHGWDTPTCKLYRFNPSLCYSKSTFIPDGFNTIFDRSKAEYVNEVSKHHRNTNLYFHHLGYALHADKFIRGKIKYYANRGIEKNVVDGYTAWKDGNKATINEESPGKVIRIPYDVIIPPEIQELRDVEENLKMAEENFHKV